MSRPWIPLRAVSLAVLFSTTWAVPANEIFRRQSATCPSNFSRCNQGSFPDNFCCPSGQKCIPLAANTTLLCCPSGSDCTRIQPISCNLSLQDSERNPRAVIKTTALNAQLARCGEGTCCPFGYICSNGQCLKNLNQNVAPVQSATPSSTSSSPSSTRTSTEASKTPSDDDKSSEEDNNSKKPSVAVIAGVSVGAAAAVFGIAIVACIFLRRKKKDERPGEMSDPLKLTRSTSSFGNFISNPIVAEDSTLRTDFGRVPPTRKPVPESGDSATLGLVPPTLGPVSPVSPESISVFPRPPPTILKNNTARQSSIAYGFGAPATSPYIYGENLHSDDENTLVVPQTPKRTQEREPSSVSINVFADPRTLTPESTDSRTGATGNGTVGGGYAERYNRLTTFTQMMEEADLGAVARGQSYVPYRPPSSQQGSPSVTRR